MANKKNFSGMLAKLSKIAVLTFGFMALILTGCPKDADDNSGGGGTTTGNPVTVSLWPLDGKVIAPVKNAVPVTTPIDTAQYTGTIAWQTADGRSHTGSFADGAVYKAIITLTAKSGFTFTGVEANSFT